MRGFYNFNLAFESLVQLIDASHVYSPLQLFRVFRSPAWVR